MKNTISKEYGGMNGTYTFYIKTIRGFKKQVGWIDRDLIFRKNINLTHKFQAANALGIDYGLIEYLDSMKCQKIVLKEELRLYSISYKLFKEKGYKYPTSSSVKAQGTFQLQWMLDLKYWKIKTKTGEVIQEEWTEPKEDDAQLNLL